MSVKKSPENVLHTLEFNNFVYSTVSTLTQTKQLSSTPSSRNGPATAGLSCMAELAYRPGSSKNCLALVQVFDKHKPSSPSLLCFRNDHVHGNSEITNII
jgi:hypothetical protein